MMNWIEEIMMTIEWNKNENKNKIENENENENENEWMNIFKTL